MPGNRFQDIYGWMIQNDIFPKYQFTVSWCFFTASWLNSLVARMHIDSSARYLRFWNEAQLSDFTAPEICLPVRHELSQLVASSNLIQKDPWYIQEWQLKCTCYLPTGWAHCRCGWSGWSLQTTPGQRMWGFKKTLRLLSYTRYSPHSWHYCAGFSWT